MICFGSSDKYLIARALVKKSMAKVTKAVVAKYLR
jgi:hypothetical protein